MEMNDTMTELSEEDKIEIEKILNEMDNKVKEVKNQCTNDIQRDIINEIEKLLDKCRK